jgi:hypothetical protein
MTFWRRLLEGTSWQTLLSYVSPAFFQLVSPRDMSRTAYRLVRNWFDEQTFRDVVQQRASSIEPLGCGLSIVGLPRGRRNQRPFHSEALPPGGSDPRCRTGDKALILFFNQIYSEGPVLLDLRRSHFFCEHSAIESNKRFVATPLYSTWSPSFRSALRDLYAAFYGGASHDVYLAALASLGIEPVADTFERAFGGERRTKARFQLSDFRSTFHEVFLHCLDARKTLQPDFLTLGIAIATLYDHLELDGGVYNVAQCYARALGHSQCPSGCDSRSG